MALRIVINVFRVHFAQRHWQLLSNYGQSKGIGFIFLRYAITLEVRKINPEQIALANVLYLFYYLDVVGLITLTYVQSNEYFPIHKFGFALFLIASVLHMMASLAVNSTVSVNIRHLKQIFYAHLASIALCMYCYYHHNAYCQGT